MDVLPAHPLAVGRRRLAAVSLERAGEVELVVEAGAVGDLAHRQVAEPQQPGGLEHPAIGDQLLGARCRSRAPARATVMTAGHGARPRSGRRRGDGRSRARARRRSAGTAGPPRHPRRAAACATPRTSGRPTATAADRRWRCRSTLHASVGRRASAARVSIADSRRAYVAGRDCDRASGSDRRAATRGSRAPPRRRAAARRRSARPRRRAHERARTRAPGPARSPSPFPARPARPRRRSGGGRRPCGSRSARGSRAGAGAADRTRSRFRTRCPPQQHDLQRRSRVAEAIDVDVPVTGHSLQWYASARRLRCPRASPRGSRPRGSRRSPPTRCCPSPRSPASPSRAPRHGDEVVRRRDHVVERVAGGLVVDGAVEEHAVRPQVLHQRGLEDGGVLLVPAGELAAEERVHGVGESSANAASTTMMRASVGSARSCARYAAS